MSGPVPESRIVCLDGAIRITKSVRSGHWIHPAWLHNWIAGRGRPAVPACGPMVAIQASSWSHFVFRVHQAYQHTRYRFSVMVSAETEGAIYMEIPVGTPVVNGERTHNRRNAVPFTFDVDVSARVESEVDLSLRIAALLQPIIVESISVEAFPRAFLDLDSNDLGCDRLSFWPRAPISEQSFANNLLDLQSVLKRSARRGMWHQVWGSDAPASTSSTSLVDILDGTFGLIGRFLYSGETTREMSWRVRGYCSDGTTAGEVVITNTGTGAGSTITIPAGSTSADWFPATSGAPDTFTCDCEDNTASDGLQGGAVDEHTIQFRRTAGSGTLEIESISVWEAPGAAPPAPSYQRITEQGDPRITEQGDRRITE